ncbi:serum paraoxonase/arylesterase 1-like isoform X1 [Mytilus edulis]|uniref:serum paraoxonase/arylesterase 1-like isoform X1 n=2 Tax=Mytilus edulis TaxID=6550 RepID=UPI0039F1158C
MKDVLFLRHTMLFKLGFVLFCAAFTHHVYKYILLMQYEKYDVIYTHYPGPCKQLLGKDGGGSEDITTLSDGLTFISSGFFPSSKGRILTFNLSDPDETLTELVIEPTVPKFHPVGLSAWEEQSSNKITLFVVNTGFDGGVTETIEVFEFKRGISKLWHIKTISSEGRLMNDILAISNESFYATQYLEYYNNKYLSPLEIYGMMKLGKVWFYDGHEFKQVISDLGYPNGINASPDLSTIYIAEFWSKQINAFKRQKDNSLHLMQTLFIDTAPDNIEVDPVTGDLWIGCHARTHLLHKYEEVNGQSWSPSQVLKIKTKNGNLTSDIKEVFLDNGEFCSGSATASYYKGRLLIGTVGTELILCDVLYNP